MENYDPFMDEIDCALVNQPNVTVYESSEDIVDINSIMDIGLNESTILDEDVRCMFEAEQEINFNPLDDDILDESFNDIDFD